VTAGERIAHIAAQRPEADALIAVGADGAEQRVSWRELESGANRAARVLQRTGVDHRSLVAVSLPAGVAHVTATLGAWKLGAMVLPINPMSTDAEQRRLLAAAPDMCVVGEGARAALTPERLRDEADDSPLPFPTHPPRSAMATGGSTGKPRIVVLNRDWTFPMDGLPTAGDVEAGLRLRQVALVSMPLYHAGFGALHYCLALEHTVVLLEVFRPQLFVEAIRRYSVNCLRTVPAAMRAVLDVPGISPADFASIEAFHHTAASCPESVKRAWLELVRPAALYEDYDSVERIGTASIRGDEWLRHPGSVGRPRHQVRILDESGAGLPPGRVGEVFMRSASSSQPVYIGGGPPLPEVDGFLSVGDLGYLDDQGYLYLVGRRSDVVTVGGTKVYAKEVEEVLLSHPAVRDALVLARPHDYLGQAVHAQVVIVPGRTVSQVELFKHCRGRLVMAKIPLTYEFVHQIARSAAGKVRRR
jgi:bile acid-coenzyme A ligase